MAASNGCLDSVACLCNAVVGAYFAAHPDRLLPSAATTTADSARLVDAVDEPALVGLPRVPAVPPLDRRDASGWTALHYAANNGHTDCARLLLQKGADVNARTAMEFTPLVLAKMHDHVDCAAQLVRYGGIVPPFYQHHAAHV